jgi:hypothetical protein
LVLHLDNHISSYQAMLMLPQTQSSIIEIVATSCQQIIPYSLSSWRQLQVAFDSSPYLFYFTYLIISK